MNRVATENEMVTRRTTQVVLDVRIQEVQRRKHSFSMQPIRDSSFANGLHCQTPREGNNHSSRHLPRIPSLKTTVAAMSDSIRGSL